MHSLAQIASAGKSLSDRLLGNESVYALALSPGYATDGTLFAGNYDGVFKSIDGGASWSAVNTGLTELYVLALALSPGYASDRTLFAGTDGGGVFKSTNGGASWSAVNTGLTSLYVGTLALSPGYASDHTLFAGTYGGVFKSSDGGASWSAMNEGLGNLDIQSLALTPTFPRTLFAGTWGSSVWQYRPPLHWLYLPVVLKRSTGAWCDLYELNEDPDHPWGPLQSAQFYQAKLCAGDARG